MHEGVELAEGAAPGVTDLRECGARVCDEPGFCLDDHRGHVVADQIVQLTSEFGAQLEPTPVIFACLRARTK